MHVARDVYDYSGRLAVAVLLCPVAAGAWFAFALSGFSFDGFMAYLGALSRDYGGMNEDERHVFRLQAYSIWGAMAFGFLFLTFVLKPPGFSYRLVKEDGHWNTDVVGARSETAVSK